MPSTWLTGFGQQAVRNASGLVSWVSVRDIDRYKFLTSSHRVSHTVNGHDLHSSRRDGAKPRVHGEHAEGEASLQEGWEGQEGQRQSGWQSLSPSTRVMRWCQEGLDVVGGGWGALPTGSLWAQLFSRRQGESGGSSGTGFLGTSFYAHSFCVTVKCHG